MPPLTRATSWTGDSAATAAAASTTTATATAAEAASTRTTTTTSIWIQRKRRWRGAGAGGGGDSHQRVLIGIKDPFTLSYTSTKHFNFITRLYSMDLFTVFGKLSLDLFHYEIKSYSLENKVTYVLKIGNCGKRQFLTRFEFSLF